MREKTPVSIGLPHPDMQEGDIFSTPVGDYEKVLRREVILERGIRKVRFLVAGINEEGNARIGTYHWMVPIEIKKPTPVE